MKTKFTAYITKWAMTSGIVKHQVYCAESCPSMVAWQCGDSGFVNHAHGEGKEWHITEASALRRAETMRKAAIRSAKKRLAKLETMTFTIP